MAATNLMNPGLFIASAIGRNYCPTAFEEWEMESIPQFRADALDRLVAAGRIGETIARAAAEILAESLSIILVLGALLLELEKRAMPKRWKKSGRT
jgi:hypothetical protein